MQIIYFYLPIIEEMLTELAMCKSQILVNVMKSLNGDIKIPTTIANDSGIRTNHISKVS